MNKVTTLLVALSFGLFAPSLISCGDKVEDIDQPTKEEKVAQAKADAEAAKAGVYKLEISFSAELDSSSSSKVGFGYMGLYDKAKCSPALSVYIDSLLHHDYSPVKEISLFCGTIDAPEVFKSPIILTTKPSAHGCQVALVGTRGSVHVKGFYNDVEIADTVMTFPSALNEVHLGVVGIDTKILQERLGIKDEN